MGVLKNTKIGMLDSLIERELTLMRFLLQLPENSLEMRELTSLRILLQWAKVLRCMDEMFM